MINKNDSLMNIAKQVVSESDRPLSIGEVAEKVFAIKGIKPNEGEITQFGIDFMLSGEFACNGNRNKEAVWDLKSRQPASVLDKDVIEDLLADDEDVKNNILSDENLYDDVDIDKNSNINDDDEDDDDSSNETDDIAEELGLISESDDEDFVGTEEIVVERDDEDEDEESEEANDSEDLEDIVEGVIKE